MECAQSRKHPFAAEDKVTSEIRMAPLGDINDISSG